MMLGRNVVKTIKCFYHWPITISDAYYLFTKGSLILVKTIQNPHQIDHKGGRVHLIEVAS